MAHKAKETPKHYHLHHEPQGGEGMGKAMNYFPALEEMSRMSKCGRNRMRRLGQGLELPGSREGVQHPVLQGESNLRQGW